jgi:hypothetical protein
MPLGFAIAGQPSGYPLHVMPCHSDAEAQQDLCFPSHFQSLRHLGNGNQ